MTDSPQAADSGHRVLLDALQGVQVRFWTCPNKDHSRVTWTGDVASCDSCGMTSVMTARLIRAAAAYERERIVQLAIDHDALIMAECDDCQRERHPHEFADLIRVPGAEA